MEKCRIAVVIQAGQGQNVQTGKLGRTRFPASLPVLAYVSSGRFARSRLGVKPQRRREALVRDASDLLVAEFGRYWETMAYVAAVAAFSINAATSCACERKIAWLPGSSMTCDWARFAMNRSRSGLIIRSCLGITA